MDSKEKLSVVVDIGTSKMVAVAGTKNESGKLEIAGIAKTEARGIKRGVVYNIEEAAASVLELINQLENRIGENIESVKVAYAGQHMKTIHFQRSRFTSDEGIVSKSDIEYLVEQAKTCELEEGFRMMEVIPVAFFVDNEIIERNPVGITGRKIEAIDNPQNAGAAGAAMVCAAGLGIIPSIREAKKMVTCSALYNPDSKNHEAYEKNYSVFRQIHSANRKLFKLMNS